MRLGLVSRVAGTAVVALLLAGSPAWAASADIVSLTSAGDGLRVVVELNDLGADEAIDLDSAVMTVNGDRVESTAKLAKDAVELTQEVMLVLDTSGSMRGDRLAAAKDAALGFVDSVPESVRVGLIRFSSTATVAVPPTADHQAVANAVTALRAGGATVLYDAVVLASQELRAADVGSAVVLSDGADRTSEASLEEAVAAAEQSGAVFDSVAFEGDRSQVESLEQISAATNGSVETADDAGQLAIAFDDAAQAIASRVIVTGTVPEDLSGGSVSVGVTLEVGDTSVADTAIVPLAEVTAAASQPQLEVVSPPSRIGSWAGGALGVALVGIFLALVVLVFVAMTSADKETLGTSRMRRSLSVYTMGGRSAPAKERETTVLGDTQVARSAVEFAGKVVSRRDLESLLGGRLEAAGLPLRAAEWLLIHVGIAILSGLFFMVAFGMRFLPTVVGLALGLMIPWLYLSIKESRRIKAFLAALPDTLQLIAGSLSAGYSMPQAVDTVVREGQPPMSSEFNRALIEARLGVPLEDALDGIATRMKSQDFSWVVMAIRIQREVGGNLAEVLTTVAATLRERERLRRQVQVLSAEGRLSAWILGALPVVFTVYLILVRPDYLTPMVQTLFGWVLIGLGVLLLFVGVIWLRRAIRVEV